MLRLDRLRALVGVYPGEEREDEMVAAFDFCLHGRGPAVPSIDTAMHGRVTAAHVDHLHPDSGIAVATAAEGERLTKEIYGDRVVWVPGAGLASSSASTSPPCTTPTLMPSASSSAATASRPGAPQRAGRGELAVDHRPGAALHRAHANQPFGAPVADHAPLGAERRP